MAKAAGQSVQIRVKEEKMGDKSPKNKEKKKKKQNKTTSISGTSNTSSIAKK
jgi:hypothetical protein